MEQEINEAIMMELKEGITTCAFNNLRIAGRVVTQIYDNALRPIGLRAGQLTLLINIARSGSPTINQLARLMVMDRTTLTRDLKPLERDGFVTVQAGREDQRTRQISLTEKGQAVMLEGVPLRSKVQQQVLQKLGEKEFETLLKLLAEMTALQQNS